MSTQNTHRPGGNHEHGGASAGRHSQHGHGSHDDEWSRHGNERGGQGRGERHPERSSTHAGQRSDVQAGQHRSDQHAGQHRGNDGHGNPRHGRHAHGHHGHHGHIGHIGHIGRHGDERGHEQRHEHEHEHDHEHDHEQGRHAHGRGHDHGEGHQHGPHGGHGRGRGGPGSRGEGRRKRLFSAAELSLVLLHLMEGQARHGYELIRELDSRTGGAYAPSPGIVYPTLTALEEAGLIAAVASAGAKRMFGITDAGKAFLAEQQEAVAVALARLAAILATVSQVDTGPVARAMQNLAMVLEHRLASPQEKQALFDIADLIDDIARKIERMA